MRVKILILGLAALLVWTLPALAQGNPTGKLSGRVTSDDQPLPGVLVTVASPNLQGTKTTSTSENGDYLFPSLPPGEYTVTFELQGLETVNRELRIAAAQTVPLDVEMAASTITEEITVTGTLENISQGVQSATTYTKTLVDELPAGRTINQIVALSPGVQPNGPSKSSETGLGNITISGAPTYENLFLLNGVVLNENIRGQAFDLFIEDAIQETTTATAGVSAEYGRFSGGVVNVITKSGGNDFSGSLRTTLNNQKWQEKTSLTTTQTDDTVPTYEATLGGPILRDRLWFFLAGRDRELNETRNTGAFRDAAGNILPGTNIPYSRVVDQQRYEGKLTATVTPRHSLLGSYSKIDEKENGNSFQTILDLASLVNRELPQELWSINYTGTFTDALLLTAQYSEREFSFIGSGATSTDLIAGTLLLDRSRGNARYHSPTFCGVCDPEERDNTNALAKVSYFLSSGGLGSHDLVAGYDTFEDIRVANNHQSGSDWRVNTTGATITSTAIFPVIASDGSTLITFNPILRSSEGTSFKTNSYFVNDTWRFSDRLTLGLGLRYDQNDGENAAGQKVADDSNLSPRLAATYDTRGNGNLVLHGSYGQYVAALANSIADSSSVGGVPAALQWAYRGPAISGVSQDEALRQLFNWFATANGGLPTVDNPLGGGLQPVIGASIPGVNQQIRGSLDSPDVTEYTLGVTARIGSRGLVRADAVYRDWANFYHQRTDTSTGRVSGRLGTVVQNFDLTLVENNDDFYERTYKGLHTQFRFRATDQLDFGGNWTLSETEGNYNAENQGSGPLTGGLGNYPEYRDVRWNAPKGPLAIDQRHRVNLYGVYKVFSSDRHSLSASLLESYASGHPYEAAANITLINPATRANYVPNPGYLTPPVRVGYFFTERGAFTTPDYFRTDISLNYDFRIGSVDLFVKPEVLNVFDSQKVDTTDVRYFDTTVLTADNNAACPNSPTGRCLAFNPFTETPIEGVHWVKGQNFGKAINALGFQLPRTYRVGIGLRF
ncbi:MAG TPA: TonB-dependent receptor [Thermoanaerobaculia bacterium]|jgi:outer membrane receptor for ferrienterochelin and colicin